MAEEITVQCMVCAKKDAQHFFQRPSGELILTCVDCSKAIIERMKKASVAFLN